MLLFYYAFIRIWFWDHFLLMGIAVPGESFHSVSDLPLTNEGVGIKGLIENTIQKEEVKNKWRLARVEKNQCVSART
jgi:hypothetical protein